jgi:hypothetical protein
MRTTASLSLLALFALTAQAPSASAAEPAAAPDAAVSVYCVYLDPTGVGTIQLHPGGKYCVPGP